MDKFRVTLTAEERSALEQLLKRGKTAARKLTHARTLLLADTSPGLERSDDDIVAAVGIGPRTIARIRKRFVTEGFAAALDHRPQPPRPDKIKIKGDVEQELVRIACSDPPKGRCHWTLELLADELAVLGLVKAVSTETVRQALKKTTLTPGSSRPGVFRPMPTCSLMTRGDPWCASTSPASNSSGRSESRTQPGREHTPRLTTSTRGRE
jgi:Homeodomain-like domain